MIERNDKKLEQSLEMIVRDENTMRDKLNNALTIYKLHHENNFDVYLLAKVHNENTYIGLIDKGIEKGISYFSSDLLDKSTLLPFVPFRIGEYISTGKKSISNRERIQHYIFLNEQYEIDSLMLRYYKNENYEIDRNQKILSNLPFSKGFGGFNMVIGMTKVVSKSSIINGEHEFVFEKGCFGLDTFITVLTLFNLLVKYCYGVQSYTELQDRVNNSNEPQLIHFIQILEKISDKFPRTIQELILLLNKKELNPNITIQDIVFGETNQNILTLNPFSYYNIFSEIIEQRERDRVRKIKEMYKE